jgi:hypothetical protein
VRRAWIITLPLWTGLSFRALAVPPDRDATPIEVSLPETAAEAEELPRDKPDFSAKITFDNAVGSGILVSNDYLRNPSYSLNLYLLPSYNFGLGGHKLSFGAREVLSYAVVLDKTSPTDRRADWSDLWLTLSDSKVYEEPHSHIKLGASLRGIVPLSYASRFASMITGVAASTSLSKSFYRLDLSAGIGIQKNFFRYTSIQIPCSGPSPIVLSSGETVQGYNSGICRPGDPSAPTTATALNADYSIFPSASGTYHFTDRLSFTLRFIYYDSFLYPSGSGFSTGAVDSNGKPIAQSNGRADTIWGITDLDYILDEHFTLSLGIWNSTNPRTPNNQGYYFPFADVTSLASNSFIFFFDIGASI